MTRWNLIGICLLTALVALAAGATEPEASAPSDVSDTSDAAESAAMADAVPASSLQALTVTRDPETGALGVPGHAAAEELTKELYRMLNEKMAGVDPAYRIPATPAPVKGAGGLPGYRLGLGQLSFAVVRTTDDGALVQDCDEAEEAAEILARPVARPIAHDATAEDR